MQVSRNPVHKLFAPSLIIGLLVALDIFGCLWLSVLLLQPLSLRAAQARPGVDVAHGTAAPRGAATPTPAPTQTPKLVFQVVPRPSPTPLAARAPRPVPAPLLTPASAAPAAPAPPASPSEHLRFGRPVPADAADSHPAWIYLYGTTEQGTLEVHHGVEFVNPIGTPLLAVGDGIVVVAGSDDTPVCGEGFDVLCGPTPSFYGNLVVLQLNAVYHDQPVYALYGHMDSIAVHVGDRVRGGQPLGAVGMTGVAQGPHLHFEIRVGVDDYAHTRNPLLWLQPLADEGMLAGRAVGPDGAPLVGAEVDLLDANGGQIQFSETYGLDDEPRVNVDDDLGENFAFGDLPAGQYQVRVIANGREYRQPVTIEPGRAAFAILREGG